MPRTPRARIDRIGPAPPPVASTAGDHGAENRSRWNPHQTRSTIVICPAATVSSAAGSWRPPRSVCERYLRTQVHPMPYEAPAMRVRPKPTRSGWPALSQGWAMRATPTKPTTIARIRRPGRRSDGTMAMVARTVAIGVMALPIPASAELTRSSPSGKRTNGREARKTATTSRWRQTCQERGRRPPVRWSRSTTVAAPRTMRPVAIWTGENHRSPIFMNRKLAPQMTASDPNFTCHGTRCRRTGASSAPEPAPLSTFVTSRVTRTR